MDRLPHAMIMEASDKIQIDDIRDFLSALILCKSEDSNFRPCGLCHACKKLKAKSHPDFTLIEGKNSSRSIHIADIRQIISDAYIIPSESDYRLFIIENADNMTIQAQNALLKILEEPPKGVFIILICQHLDAILATVRSRTQIFNLSNNINNSEASQGTQEAKDFATSLIHAVINNNQYEFLLNIAPLIKNKDLIKQVLEQMLIIIQSAIRLHYLNNNFDSQDSLIKNLVKKFNINSLIKKSDIISAAHKRIDSNVNQSLNLTYICFQFFENN